VRFGRRGEHGRGRRGAGAEAGGVGIDNEAFTIALDQDVLIHFEAMVTPKDPEIGADTRRTCLRRLRGSSRQWGWTFKSPYDTTVTTRHSVDDTLAPLKWM
jgi:hypothetical protein